MKNHKRVQQPFSRRIKVIITPLTKMDNKDVGYASIGSYVCNYRFGMPQTLPYEVVGMLKEAAFVTVKQTQEIDEEGMPYVRTSQEKKPRYHITVLPSDSVDTTELQEEKSEEELKAVVTREKEGARRNHP